MFSPTRLYLQLDTSISSGQHVYMFRLFGRDRTTTLPNPSNLLQVMDSPKHRDVLKDCFESSNIILCILDREAFLGSRWVDEWNGRRPWVAILLPWRRYGHRRPARPDNLLFLCWQRRRQAAGWRKYPADQRHARAPPAAGRGIPQIHEESKEEQEMNGDGRWAAVISVAFLVSGQHHSRGHRYFAGLLVFRVLHRNLWMKKSAVHTSAVR